MYTLINRLHAYDWHIRLFLLTFTSFIASQFFIQKDNVWDIIFYLAVIPSLVICLIRDPSSLTPWLRSRSVQLILVLLVWLCLSVFWQPEGDNWFDRFHYLRRSILVVMFLTASLIFFRTLRPQEEKWVALTLMLLASACGVLSLVAFLGGWQAGVRLEPIGQLEQPILGASVYGLAGLISLLAAWRSCGLARAGACAAFVITALVVYFSYSRGQLLAFSLTAIAMTAMLSQRQNRKLLYAIMVLLIAGALTLAFIPGLSEALLSLKECRMLLRDSYRLAIWEQALHMIYERPLLGWGAAHEFWAVTHGIKAPHTHNLFLGTVFQGGLVAGILLGIVLIRLSHRIRQIAPNDQSPLLYGLLLYILLSTLTDHPILVDSPAPFWTLFWLPVSYIIVHTHPKE